MDPASREEDTRLACDATARDRRRLALVLGVGAMGLMAAIVGLPGEDARPRRAAPEVVGSAAARPGAASGGGSVAGSRVEQAAGTVSLCAGRLGPLEVRLLGARLAPVSLRDALFGSRAHLTERALLSLELEVVHRGREDALVYNTWAGDMLAVVEDFARLTDDAGRRCMRVGFPSRTPPVGRTEVGLLFPGEALTDVLVFEEPADGAEVLWLDLPGENVGCRESLRLELPRAGIDH